MKFIPLAVIQAAFNCSIEQMTAVLRSGGNKDTPTAVVCEGMSGKGVFQYRLEGVQPHVASFQAALRPKQKDQYYPARYIGDFELYWK